jgi:hypothetical protein
VLIVGSRYVLTVLGDSYRCVTVFMVGYTVFHVTRQVSVNHERHELKNGANIIFVVSLPLLGSSHSARLRSS